MWMKWFPWRWAIQKFAKAQGFLDPFRLLSQFQGFAQPSEVAVPVEILRLAFMLHVRGVMNSQAIQHNLDWVWPFWVERQFDPADQAFIPRAFSVSHINLTHRNWTAVGIPDSSYYPIVDPAGLVTPHLDSWSLDAWILFDSGEDLIPSRLPDVSQKLLLEGNLSVRTETHLPSCRMISEATVIGDPSFPICQIKIQANADVDARCVVALRPYNPEGVSFIHQIDLLEGKNGWKVDKKECVYLEPIADHYAFSDYRTGDVHPLLPNMKSCEKIVCKVGMATAAAIYELVPGKSRTLRVEIPLVHENGKRYETARQLVRHRDVWNKNLGYCELKIPDPQFQFLYDAALKNLVLHAPKEVYPGPYTYKHFWFRDAAFILHAMLCTGLFERVEKVIEASFFSRQNPFGYFHSQDGEWDSNGQVLWLLKRFCELSGRKPKAEWKKPVEKAAHWIERKRLKGDLPEPHAGLFPPGFSAEHLGPNDYYYWDDFWGAAGLEAAAYFAAQDANETEAGTWSQHSRNFLECIDRSLKTAQKRLGHAAMPASPYRRMDTGAIGSLAGGYPLQLWEPQDPRLLKTIDYLMEKCFVHGGFFHDMSHSGINPYLTLHIAQILLRAGDPRYYEVMKAVADLASPTGQWPEAIHPQTKGGCMGDGQHIWAAAEWILMIRSCFLREEGNRLILFSGIPPVWFENGNEMVFGPAPTKFGPVRLSLKVEEKGTQAGWERQWFSRPPQIVISLQGHENVIAPENQNHIEIPRRVKV